MFFIRLAGVPIGVDNRYAPVGWLCRNYQIESGDPAFTVRASDKMLIDELRGILSWSRDLTAAEAEELKKALQVEKPPSDEQEYREKIISCGGKKPVIPLETWSYLEELNVYRQICRKLINFDAFVLHAAVIAINGAGIAFVGKHGAGKSTRLRLWEDAFGKSAAVINGDKPAIRLLDGTLYACGTPWNGKENRDSNCMVPLKVLCFVERSTRVEIRRLQTEEISHRIFDHLLIPDNAADLKRLAGLINTLIGQIPCYLLKCCIEDGEDPLKIWNRIRQDINI